MRAVLNGIIPCPGQLRQVDDPVRYRIFICPYNCSPRSDSDLIQIECPLDDDDIFHNPDRSRGRKSGREAGTQVPPAVVKMLAVLNGTKISTDDDRSTDKDVSRNG